MPKLSRTNADIVAAACRLIESADESPDLEAMAANAGLSPFHFHRVFKQVTGLTPKAYASAKRGEKLRDALGKSASVTHAIYDAGFQSSSRFYEKAVSMLGMAPAAFRAGGKGETLLFAAGECSLGTVVVASSAKGVCCLLLGDDPDALVRELQQRFPKAELVGGDANYEGLIAKVVGFIDQPSRAWTLPLDIRGTAFQQQVWRALREIPFGATVTYAEIAERIQHPTATRAVAGACGANHLAVVIPCHRVVRSDGGISGYRWGVDRKRALLLKEKKLRVES